MRYLLGVSFLVLLLSCTRNHDRTHIADLPASTAPVEKILLLQDKEVNSSSPLHNVVPPHGSKQSGNINWALSGNCVQYGDAQICGSSFMMNSGFILSLELPGKTPLSEKFNPSISDFLYRFIGAPPASLYSEVKFFPETIGLMHTFGFTLIRQGRFCRTIELNPNHRVSFGIAEGKVLLFSSGPSLSVDRSVGGWRKYNEESNCL
ncbi:MAG: hypothetical protein IPK04_06815 [Bdellovibrionales bacterium]|nr:hypothetical protein [Bdellovibrionales bacterium]